MRRFLCIIGNILDHYDQALYALIAPFIAPLFFASESYFTSLLLGYCILPLGALAKPIGSAFFGYLGDLYGREKALEVSLLGMAIATLAMGALPTYALVGNLSPILLLLCKMSQSFFSAGESASGAIFLLEKTQEAKRSFFGSLYNASSILGILLASSLVTLLSSYQLMETSWRLLFLGGALTACIGYFLRRSIPKTFSHKVDSTPLLKLLLAHKGSIIRLIFVSGFSYAVYAASFTLMNAMVPLITKYSNSDVLQVNSYLLLFDLCLLPLFGYLAVHTGKIAVMSVAALCTAIVALPLFLLLPTATLSGLILIRSVFVTFGVAFAASYHAWALEQFPKQVQGRLFAIGGALGAQLLGLPTTAISLWLFQVTNWVGAPAVYIGTIGLAAFVSVAFKRKTIYAGSHIKSPGG